LLLLFLVHWGCSKIPDIPTEGESWSFITFGDVRNGYGIYSYFAGEIGAIQPTPELSICLGDILKQGGNEIEWIDFWRLSEPITDVMPLYLVRGNHEGNELVFSEQTGLPADMFYYSFSHRDCFFIILDSHEKGHEVDIGPSQFDWLKNQLDYAYKQIEFHHIFIFLHYPVFPKGKYRNYPMKIRDQLHSLFVENNKIRAVFAGHEHSFNRSKKDSINYIITGGGGSPLDHRYGGDYFHFLKISVFEKNNRINVKSIGIYNEVVDEFDL